METIYILYTILGISFLPILIWAVVVQIQVDTTFRNFSGHLSKSNITADAAAKMMLEKNNIHNIQIEKTRGTLTDHFHPKKKIIALSEPVFGSTSVAAIGIAAHECGHAIQHAKGYWPLKIRAFLVPVVNFLSYMFFPLVIVGIVLSSLSYAYGFVIVCVALALYGASTLFYLITLPVELNASKRALAELKQMQILDEQELRSVKKVLRSAAMTYIVSFLSSLVYLLRFVLSFVLIFSDRN